MNEKILAIWLSEALGPGSIHAKTLIERYKSFSDIYRLGKSEYLQLGIKEDSRAMQRLLDKNTDAAEKAMSFCEYNHFGIVEYSSTMYPKRLRSIKDPPLVFYVRGRMIEFDDNVCIAVVGTRSYSDIGWNSTYKIATGLACSGAVIVTGLASGIDTAATRAALTGSGFAVGVLGSGIEKVYPSENRELFEEMYVKGLVISECAPFTDITGKYFPVRNRLISGLCNAVMVGEGSIRSGAMITAAHASEQGRHVFAIPGDISGQESSGVNKLIREGATPVFDHWDILKNYEYLYPHRITNVHGMENTDVPTERSAKRVRVFKGSAPTEHKKEDVTEKTVTKTAGLQKTVSDADKKTYPSVMAKVSGKTGNKAHGSKLVFEKVYEANMDKLEVEHPHESNADVSEALSDIEKRVYNHISSRDFCISDSVADEIGEDRMEVAVAMTTLEIAGLITAEGPKVRKV